MTTVLAEDILTALQTRLRTIKTAAGYLNDVKQVVMDSSMINLQVAERDLPLIEIINGPETYQHQVGSSYWATTEVILQITAPKAYTDGKMERILRDVRRCLFGGTSNGSGNTGMTLGGLVQNLELVDCQPDLNLIQSNRIYMLRIRLKSHRTTYKD